MQNNQSTAISRSIRQQTCQMAKKQTKEIEKKKRNKMKLNSISC